MIKKLMLVVVGLATAAITASAVPIACPDDTTFSSMVAMGSSGCLSGGTLFSHFTGNLPANWDVSIYDDSGDYTVEFSNTKRNPLQAGTYHLSYYVLISPTLTNTYISSASLSADVNPFKAAHPSSLTETLKDVSSAGAIGTLKTQRDSTDIQMWTKGLMVSETMTPGGMIKGKATSRINHFTNTFEETVFVPEPVTMALVGFGLLLAGGFGRRKARLR